jgi:hypothetical protein
VLQKGKVPSLSWLKPTARRSSITAEQKRALRQAIAEADRDKVANPESTMSEWAAIEFRHATQPEHVFVLGGMGDPEAVSHARQTIYGKEFAVTKSHGRDALALAEETAGEDAPAVMRLLLREGEELEVVLNQDRDIHYFGFRLGPVDDSSRILNFLGTMQQLWQSAASPASATVAPDAATAEPCWFCKRRQPDKGSAVEVSLYAPETVRRSTEGAGLVTTNRVSYVETKVKVPRCTACEDAHQRVWLRTAGGALLGLLLGLPGSLLIYWLGVLDLSTLAAAAGWIAIVVFPAVSAFRLGKRTHKRAVAQLPAGVAPLKHKRMHPTVRALVGEGYRLGAPVPK